MTAPHPDPKPLEPWALELLGQDRTGDDPQAKDELARLVALLRALPDPERSPDLAQRILAHLADDGPRSGVIRAAFGSFRQLARPETVAMLAAGIAALLVFAISPDSIPSVLKTGADAQTGPYGNGSTHMRRRVVVRPQYVSAVFAQTPAAMPRFRPERAPLDEALEARLDRQLNQLMIDPTAFAQRLEQIAQPEQFVARLAQRAAERGDAAEIAFRVRESSHPLAPQLVERLLGATLIASRSSH